MKHRTQIVVIIASVVLTIAGLVVLALAHSGIQQPPQREPAGILFAAVMLGMILLPIDILLATGAVIVLWKQQLLRLWLVALMAAPFLPIYVAWLLANKGDG